MKVLIIKMSSMGDIIHTFPALTDAGIARPSVRFDWVVESAFQELPKWHPLVENTIPVALRKWRRQPVRSLHNGDLFSALKLLRKEPYDMIIDAQGLLKSTLVSALARGPSFGFDKRSGRESWANFLYQKSISVSRDQHAVSRVRELFAKALNYQLHNSTPDYGLNIPEYFDKRHLVFLPNTTWESKHWPEHYWKELIALATNEKYQIQIPWGAPHEEARAKRLAGDNPHVTVLPRLSITEVAQHIASARAVVALDTGLAHVAAAFSIPTVSLYGPTNPGLTGAFGSNQKLLSAKFECAPCFKRVCHYPGEKLVNPPCFSSLPPSAVWDELMGLINP